MAKETAQMFTPMFRVSYPYVLEENKNGKFSVSMVFSKEKIKNNQGYKEKFNAILAEIKRVGELKFPNGDCKRIQPMKDGDKEKPNDEVYAGSYYCEATTQFAPDVFDRNKNDILSKKEFYPGCYARARVHVYAWENNGGGVSVGFDAVQKLEDGEEIKGNDAKDSFDDMEALPSDGNTSEETDDLLL